MKRKEFLYFNYTLAPLEFNFMFYDKFSGVTRKWRFDGQGWNVETPLS